MRLSHSLTLAQSRFEQPYFLIILSLSLSIMKQVKVMWFSRHAMSDAKIAALAASIESRNDGNIQVVVTQVNGTAANVHVAFNATNAPEGTPEAAATATAHAPLKELVKSFDVVCAVLPINLQEQILPVMGNVPLLTATSERVMVEGKANFVFQKWVQVLAVKIETVDF